MKKSLTERRPAASVVLRRPSGFTVDLGREDDAQRRGRGRRADDDRLHEDQARVPPLLVQDGAGNLHGLAVAVRAGDASVSASPETRPPSPSSMTRASARDIVPG